MIRANRRNFIFEEVKQSAPERNGFDCSHENKQTARAGKLYPYECFEALPNDDFEIQTETFIRLKPMLSPTMHRVKAYWHWFFVPCRLANTHWEEFISRGNGKKLPSDQEYTPPELPTISMATLLECCTVAQRVKNVEMLVSTYSGTHDEILTYLTNKYPECLVRKKAYDSNKTCLVLSIRTPRIANALRIPDTCMPFFWIDNNKHPHWVYATETSGEMTVNQLYNLGNPGATVDIYGYYHSIKLSLLPFIATFRVWTEYYRDENLDEDYDEMLTYLTNLTGEWFPISDLHKSYAATLFELHYRCWEKDYFTTATQLPQKSPDVVIPGTAGANITGTADITGTVSTTVNSSLFENKIQGSAGHFTIHDGSEVYLNSGGALEFYDANTSQNKVWDVKHSGSISADSSFTGASVDITTTGDNSSGTTVAQVRRAFALQRWFEKVCRTGTRYIESLKAFFNSDAGDARLQRSEYLGGSSTPIQISDVVQTSATDDSGDTPQGNLAGYGIASDNSKVISYHCPEHGFVIGFFSILARTSYAQGIPKMFSRETWLDYAWPEFEHIGEQGIRQKELAAFPLSKFMVDHPIETASYVEKGNDHIFGYQSRYAEYKQCPDVFGSGFSSSQDFWTLGRIFSNAPSLNKDFVHAQVSDRNFAVIGNDVENPMYDPATADSFDLDEAYDYDTYDCDFWIDCKKVTSLTLFSEPI